MTPEKLLSVIDEYEDIFRAMGITSQDSPHCEIMGPEDGADVLAHCYGMLSKMRVFIMEKRIEKTMRWIGFIQGCLWSYGIFSLGQLQEHSRPEESLA